MYHELSILPPDLRSADVQWDLGRQYRQTMPRSQARECVIDSRDPIGLLREQDATRLQDLVPLRYGRMSVDAFRFYRGSARLMAYDLEQQPNTGVEIVSCGDAHLSNFGFYASPERSLVFDLNDFDEAAPSPWEWDLKRLAASVVLAARQQGASRKKAEAIVLNVAQAYRTTMRTLARRPGLERFYLTLRDDVLSAKLALNDTRTIERVAQKARRRDSAQAARKLLETGADGNLRFRENPPILAHVDSDLKEKVEHLYADYLLTAQPDIAVLLSGTRIVDIARRVVGVGSVGTRCYVVALLDPTGAPIILQVKEAQRSVLVNHRARNALPLEKLFDLGMSEGQRVVACQKILQAFSDSFLGWLSSDGHDFYVRQFRDMKGSFDVDNMPTDDLVPYGMTCATVLARAHAQSSVCAWIAGYLGKSDTFDRAIAAWSLEYADQAERDFDRLTQAIHDGDVEAIDG